MSYPLYRLQLASFPGSTSQTICIVWEVEPGNKARLQSVADIAYVALL